MTIPDAAREALEAGHLAHMVTLNVDGSPQVSCVWIGVDAGEIVVGSLPRNRKVQNVERDPRVVISVGTGRQAANGLEEYLASSAVAAVSFQVGLRSCCSGWRTCTSVRTPGSRPCPTRRQAT